jgi:signal transduction histidine kinase
MFEKVWPIKMKTGFILRLSVQYAVLSVLAILGYVLLVNGLSLILGYAIPANNPFLIGLLVLILAVALDPLRDAIQRNLDAVYLKKHRPYNDLLRDFSDEVAKTVGTPAVIALLRKFIEEGVQARIVHIFVYDTLGEYYFSTEDQRGYRTSDIRFSANGGLVRTMIRRKGSILLEEEMTLPVTLQSDRSRLAVLGAILIVPLFARERLAGFLALGPRSNGESFSKEEIIYIESLGVQVSQVMERSQVVTDLERRIHEMNILTRVAEGINITLAFDDTLELFYAQTNQLIPAHDMHIALLDDNRGEFYYAFYLENDERLRSRENRPLSPGYGLEIEVVESQRVIVTENYERECANLGLVPNCESVYAWMGVPLKAGTATIGAVSLASRDPADKYTQDQVNLLMAIANLAAGAIVKVRLLDETNRRARQMETLNEVTRSLTSTLEVDVLLEKILQSAVDILDCEAGSLLLVDEKTGEYVFEVAVGPVAEELVGKRVPSGAGLVGKAIMSGKPIIQNDVKRSKDWFDTDKQTGYSTEDLLVVPLEVKGRVLGALEVLNKRDRSQISIADQELLCAFAGQASVALDNVRMYTITDQALASRVEELSVLQRVDQELNASLELERAMRITLGWAIRQTKAEAGFAGLLTEEGIQVIVSQGYLAELESFVDVSMPIELPIMSEAVKSGEIQCLQISDALRDTTIGIRLLAGAHSQVALPISRGEDVIGLLFLESESAEQFTDEKVSFLSRLADHAAIAISNAQFYAEVQAANLSKSQFVSSAAHELKNPLTSIKGYSDLLMAGSVGPVSEGQTNFLETIQANVDRMATLVSDLQDISRIEAGQLRLEYGETRMDEVIHEVAQSFSSQIEEKGQTLRLDIQPDLSLVWGDRGRLVQILTNLVSNAHKYTFHGGEIQVKADQGHNLDEFDEILGGIHVCVRDTGIGISEEDQRQIFSQFFRSEDSEVRKESGTGLGLSITKNLVEMQGGQIWFESVAEEGTTFHFTIPIAEIAEEPLGEE